jgi:hypothetical protein
MAPVGRPAASPMRARLQRFSLGSLVVEGPPLLPPPETAARTQAPVRPRRPNRPFRRDPDDPRGRLLRPDITPAARCLRWLSCKDSCLHGCAPGRDRVGRPPRFPRQRPWIRVVPSALQLGSMGSMSRMGGRWGRCCRRAGGRRHQCLHESAGAWPEPPDFVAGTHASHELPVCCSCGTCDPCGAWKAQRAGAGHRSGLGDRTGPVPVGDEVAGRGRIPRWPTSRPTIPPGKGPSPSPWANPA